MLATEVATSVAASTAVCSFDRKGQYKIRLHYSFAAPPRQHTATTGLVSSLVSSAVVSAAWTGLVSSTAFGSSTASGLVSIFASAADMIADVCGFGFMGIKFKGCCGYSGCLDKNCGRNNLWWGTVVFVNTEIVTSLAAALERRRQSVARSGRV